MLDWSAISFVWTVLLVPIGYLSTAWSNQKKEIKSLTETVVSMEKDLELLSKRMADIDNKLIPLSKDLADLNTTIMQTELGLEKRLHAMTLSNLQQQQSKSKG